MDYDYDLSVLRVKKNIEIFSDHMAQLYNFSVITVTYPDLLKNARLYSGMNLKPKTRLTIIILIQIYLCCLKYLRILLLPG